jgi:nifR3 family TIM-barrel protein
MKNFWKELHIPFFVLAPMADVTDAAFRSIIAKYGKPDVMYTEFTSADGLVLAPEEGKKKLLKNFEYSEGERPIVAQLFSSKPENMEKLGFDGIDINMGCPDKNIEKQKCGAAMMKHPKLAREIIQAAQRGAPHLPISVKTRIGYNKNEISTWIHELLAEKPAALIVHCRTRKEMSKVPARWEHIQEVIKLRNTISPETVIVGNGDVIDLVDARKKCQEFSADGAMLGRAIFGNPWLFSEYIPSTKEKLEVMVEHTKLFEKLLGTAKNFSVMKKHYKAYVEGFDGAKELRVKLMETQNFEEVKRIVSEHLMHI